jgi:hypothetical protein
MITVTYADKFNMQTEGSGFFIGWHDTPEYTLDVANMRVVVRREDIGARIAPFVERTADGIVAAAPGRLDVVKELGNAVPTELVDDYFGIPSPHDGSFATQAALMSGYLFLAVGDYANLAQAAAKLMLALFGVQIAAR